MIVLGAFSFTPNNEYIVVASSCFLYEDSSFESAKVQVEEKDYVLNHGQIVIYESEENEFCLMTVKNTEISGYVYKYYICENSSISYYPVYNASIREDTEVYDSNGQQTEIILKQNQRVYLYDGFDDKKEFTPIQFVLEDGILNNGYVQTSKIKPDGVNRLLIVAIPLIAALVTIILSILFIRKKKKKNNKIWQYLLKKTQSP